MKNKGKRVAKDGSLSEAAPGIESMGYGLPAHVAKLLAKKGLSHVFWLHKRMSGAPPQKGKRPANEARSPEEHMRAISKARDEELNRLRTAISKRTKDFKGHRKSIGDREHQIRLKYQKRLRDRRASAQVVDSTEHEGPSLSEADFASALEKLKKKNPALARHRVRTTPYPSGMSRGKEKHQQETPYTEKEKAEVQSAIKYYRKNPVAVGDTAEESRSKRKFPVKSSTEYEGPSLKEVTKKLIIKTGKGMIAQSRKEAEEEKKVPQTTPYGKGHAEGEHQAKSVWIGRRVKRLMGKLAVKQQRKGQSASLSEISSKYIQKAMKGDLKRARKHTAQEVKLAQQQRVRPGQGDWFDRVGRSVKREFMGYDKQKEGDKLEKDVRGRGARLAALNKKRQEQRRSARRAAPSSSSSAREEPTTPTEPRREEEPDTQRRHPSDTAGSVARMRARQRDAAGSPSPQQASVTRTSAPVRKEDDVKLSLKVPKSVKALGGMALSRLKRAPGRLLKFAKEGGGADPSGEEGRAALHRLSPGGAAWKPKVRPPAKRTLGQEFRTRVKRMKEQHNEAKEMDWGEAFKKYHMKRGAQEGLKKEKKKKLKLPKTKKPRPSVIRREEKSKIPKATQF
jgi:hypothetical protein